MRASTTAKVFYRISFAQEPLSKRSNHGADFSNWQNNFGQNNTTAKLFMLILKRTIFGVSDASSW